MNNIALSVLSLSLAAAFSAPAVAQPYGPGRDHGRDQDSLRSDTARVTRVDRIAGGHNTSPRDHVLRQECWNERTNRNESGYYRDESGRLYKGDGGSKTARTVIGAIIGGALGNQVGDGRGQTAATIAGAAAGAAIANNSDNKHYDDRDNRFEGYDRYRDNAGDVRRCRTVEEHADGRGHGPETFRVSYVYAGQSYQAFTNFNPGRTLRVVVDVRPEQQEPDYRRR